MTSSNAYEAERLELMRRRGAVAASLATVLVPLFGIADYVNYRAHFAPLMTVRAISGVVGAMLFLLIRRQRGDRRLPWLAILLTLQCGIAIAGVPVYITGIQTPHYVSESLLLLATTAMLPWALPQVTILTLALTAMYVVAGTLHGPLPDFVLFFTQLSAIVVTAAIGFVVNLLNESMRAREFTARSELQAASKEKTRLISHLEKMTARLATANEDMQERQRETDDFLYVLSHDLRAPLINIQGFGKRLQTDMGGLSALVSADDEATKRLNRMKQSLDFLNAGTAKIDQLISRLLDVARLTTRPNRHEWIDADHMVRNVVSACRFQLEGAGVDVSIEALPRIFGDATQLNQVFTNLIDNAIKYMGDVPRKEIAIRCTTQGDRYRFAVCDSGPGIEPKDREKVFRLFARLAPNGSAAGEGVGLATVRAIINHHGGRIWVDSTPGQGSTFYFTLPKAAAEPSEEPKKVMVRRQSNSKAEETPIHAQ
ncbi:MAG: HAMP domain-containing histidine kinase [Deltaproteobacteria bacterium]|nr:HAMP domain-containing histidine kinase [Deltaproteobacteria bacterium]